MQAWGIDPKVYSISVQPCSVVVFLLVFALQLVVREFHITQTLRLKNNSEMTLHFRLGTQPPFLVLKPQPRALTSTSSNPPTGDSQSLVLQPQHSMQARWGEFWIIYTVDTVTERFRSEGWSFVWCFLWIPGEGGLRLLLRPSGACRPGRWGSPSWGDADPQCKWAEEAEVPAKPPDSLQQQ